MEQLANKAGVAKSTVSRAEALDPDAGISVTTLSRIAAALDCDIASLMATTPVRRSA